MSLKNCLNNYIGLRGYCSDTTPESGIWINDLPAISLKRLANITEEETKNYSELWEEIYSRTLNMLESDVVLKSQKFFKTNLVAENENTGYYDNPYVVSASTNELKGTTIEVYSRTSRYLSIYVNSVQLYLPSAVNGSIFIYNLMNGALLDTIAFIGVVGINTIEINKSYMSYGQDTRIFICYDSNIGNSINTNNISESSLAITNGAKIAVGTPVLKDSLTVDGNSHGMIANYNLRCDISEFICSSKDIFKFALWYKLGAEIMFENMTTTRMNKYTISRTKDEIKDLWSHFNDEYLKILEAIMNNLDVNSDNVCFSCSKKRNYKFIKN